MTTREFATRVPVLDGRVTEVVETVKSTVGNDQGAEAESVLCQNCGESGSAKAIPERAVVADTRRFEATPGIRLCGDCDREREATPRSIVTCTTESFPVDGSAVLRDEGNRCRGCGISGHRLSLGGQQLELHPVVPIEGAGHAHERNLVPLCPYCHRRVHGKQSARSEA